MTWIQSLSYNVFCPMITTSPRPGSTIYGIVNRTGPHVVSIGKRSGHDGVSISHFWLNDITTRARPTNACVNAVCVIPACPCRASTSSSDITVIAEPEYTSTLTSAAAEAPGTARRSATSCVRASKCGSVPTESTLVSPLHPAVRPRHARTKWLWNQSPHDCCDTGAGSCIGTE